MRIILVRHQIRDHFSATEFVNQQVDVDRMRMEEVVNRIVSLNDGLRRFWSNVKGWASDDAAELLSRSRLDWQVSLSVCLKIWIKDLPDEDSGKLILAWTNLGSLVEGTLKLFLSAYHGHREDLEQVKKANPRFKDPDIRSMEQLRIFYRDKIWDADWDKWISHIQQRRNAVHAFRNREIGNHEEFLKDVRRYLRLLRYINFRLPYPDDDYAPGESALLRQEL